MDNLEIYKIYFDQAYPKYSDHRYNDIYSLVEVLPSTKLVVDTLDSVVAKLILAWITPLVKIKNYKSQIPFPEKLFEVVKIMVEIKNTQPEIGLSDLHAELLSRLLDARDGFQLPTASAVLHFCHPNMYPIVDRNIESACKALYDKYSDELPISGAPELPRAAEVNKVSSYQFFIMFLDILKTEHNRKFVTNFDFRELDKALMVYGVPELKKNAEIFAMKAKLN